MQLARITLSGIGAVLAAVLGMAAVPARAVAETNAGQIKPRTEKPFVATPVATFDEPWAIGFLPDGRMLITEKPGRMYLVDPRGRKIPVSGLPKVAYGGQNGLLDVVAAPDHRGHARDLLHLCGTRRGRQQTWPWPGPGWTKTAAPPRFGTCRSSGGRRRRVPAASPAASSPSRPMAAISS